MEYYHKYRAHVAMPHYAIEYTRKHGTTLTRVWRQVVIPFEGYNQQTQSVFNCQWTRRIPAPQSVLAQMADIHTNGCYTITRANIRGYECNNICSYLTLI
eukprot:216275_1